MPAPLRLEKREKIPFPSLLNCYDEGSLKVSTGLNISPVLDGLLCDLSGESKNRIYYCFSFSIYRLLRILSNSTREFLK